MTQYVKQFPLPDLATPIGARIVQLVGRQVKSPDNSVDAEIDSLVWEAFGLVKEVGR